MQKTERGEYRGMPLNKTRNSQEVTIYTRHAYEIQAKPHLNPDKPTTNPSSIISVQRRNSSQNVMEESSIQDSHKFRVLQALLTDDLSMFYFQQMAELLTKVRATRLDQRKQRCSIGNVIP